MQTSLTSTPLPSRSRPPWLRLLLALPVIYLALLLGQPAGLDLPKIVDIIRNDPTIVLQQLITGLANGAIIVIIALGYTLVYGIIELVNFAHGDLFMLGTFTALLALSPFIVINNDGSQHAPWWAALLGFIPAMIVCASINVFIERVAYRRLRRAPKIVALISAIGLSFILQNIGLQLGSIGKLANVSPSLSFLQVMGTNNAAPKSFPVVLNNDNLLDLIFPPVQVVRTPEATPATDQTKTGATSAPGATTAPSTTGPAGPAGPAGSEDTQATVDASIQATLDAQSTADAGAGTPTEEVTASAGSTEGATPVSEATGTPEAVAGVSGMAGTQAPTPDQNATGTPDVAASGAQEATATDEATPDLGATIAAENAASGNTNSSASGNTGASGNATSSSSGQNTGSTVETVSVNKVRITIKDVLVIVVALILMLSLRWFVQNTRLGKAMRATASNRDAAQIMGINIDQIIALTFAIGGALAGAAGMMTGLYNGTAVFTMGFTAGLRSFTAAVLGGIGNITGAALGGVLIGVLAAFSDQFLSVRWTNAWVFLILVLVLLFRPTGLLSSESGEKA